MLQSLELWRLQFIGCLLITCIAKAAVIVANPTADLSSVGAGDGQCRTMCSACQSLKQSHINEICSVNLLTGCSCPEFALNLTTMQTPETGAGSNCPVTEAINRVGFCPFGQRTDPSTGCPLGVCRHAPGCQQDSNSRPLKDCKTYCPAGYATDSSGCPTCRCRCETADLDGFDRRCAADCAAVGAVGHEIRQLENSGESCPICVCRQPSLGNPRPVPAPSAAGAGLSCLLRCPNSCGQYGYTDAESRDENGCVKDCSCKCPEKQGCPSGDRCLRWEIDRFGCQVCLTCSLTRRPPFDQAVCVTKALLDATPASQQPALIGSLCPAVCPQGSSYLITTAIPSLSTSAAVTTPAGCLTCSCQQTKSSSQSAAAQLGCPSLSLDACLANCPSGNASVSKAADGCYGCRCAAEAREKRSGVVVANARPNCPMDQGLSQLCSNSCGPYGFEIDPLTGCQRSCRCNCPKQSPGACGCFYGSKKDAFGCDTCECISASEYLAFLPF